VKLKLKIIYSMGFLLILCFVYAVKLLWDAGIFKTLRTIHFQSCSSVAGVIGPEDMALLPGTSLVIVSSDSRPEDETKTGAGGLIVYDYVQRQIIRLTHANFPKDFFPHGLDVIPLGDRFLVSVVNQSSLSETRIEFFELDIKKLQLRWTHSLSSPHLLAANDLVLLAENEFLYTRDFDTKEPVKLMFQQYLRQHTGALWHYKQGQYQKKVSDLFFANGLAFDKATSTLYLSEMLEHAVHSYKWLSPDIKEIGTIQVPHGIDNLTFNNGFLYGAGHPKLLELKRMRDHRDHRSPSTVIKIAQDLSGLKIIYQDDGSEIAASSVALHVSPAEILVGSVFDDHFIHCVLNSVP
jgi:hypothetical protein